ncbi:MAG: hypothetical protein JWP22_3549, partial [Ramlibacter sp.]|nr:hypothetical protein [Ramlibacter sp.]
MPPSWRPGGRPDMGDKHLSTQFDTELN